VDKEKCIGTGTCVRLAPGVFEFDLELLAQVKDPDGAGRDILLEAARKCPTQAIQVEDDPGVVFPEVGNSRPSGDRSP
jgi:ferredoxin